MKRFALLLLSGGLLIQTAGPQSQTAPLETLTGIQDRLTRSDLAGARAQLDPVLRQYPADGRLYNLQGVIAARLNDYAGAEAAFSKAVRLSPGLTGAWLNLGRLYQTSLDRDPQAARKGMEVYRRILSAQPDLPEANYQLALLLVSQGGFRESIPYLDRLPPEDRGRTNALALRCAAEAGVQDNRAALATARQLLERHGLDEADITAILPMLEKAKAGEIARALLEGLSERKLASRDSFFHLAVLYERSGDLSRARAAFETVAQATPGTAEPLLDLARIAWKQKDYEGALSYIAQARDIEPNNAAIHFLFGVTSNEMHLAVEAKQALEKALALAPDNAYYNYAMGVIAMQWADKQPAIPYLRKYTAAKPDDPRGHLALATAHFLLFEFDDAKVEAARVADDPALRPAAQYLLGCIARQAGDFDEAAGHLQTALKLAPGLAEAHAELALVLLGKEDFRGAEREAQVVLNQDPDNFTANQALLQIYRNARDPRVEAQAGRVKNLVEDRNRKLQLMMRTIEVRPY